jgi:hypothetical protein
MGICPKAISIIGPISYIAMPSGTTWSIIFTSIKAGESCDCGSIKLKPIWINASSISLNLLNRPKEMLLESSQFLALFPARLRAF